GDQLDPAAAHPGGEAGAGEALAQQERINAGGVPGNQVRADLAFTGGGGHDGPGACPGRCGRPAEAVEPFDVGTVPAEPGGQVVARAVHRSGPWSRPERSPTNLPHRTLQMIGPGPSQGGCPSPRACRTSSTRLKVAVGQAVQPVAD